MLEVKVEGIMEDAWEALWRYIHTAELRHRPWAIQFISTTLCSNAKFATDLLNAWKPKPLKEIIFELQNFRQHITNMCINDFLTLIGVSFKETGSLRKQSGGQLCLRLI